jgi:hypothetical protein
VAADKAGTAQDKDVLQGDAHAVDCAPDGSSRRRVGVLATVFNEIGLKST